MLVRALTQDRIPHSYVFAGPDGVGKTLLARRLAQVLLCEKPVHAETTDGITAKPRTHAEACGVCSACRQVATGNHPDLHVIARQLKRFSQEERVRRSRGVELSIDVIREFLIEKSGEKSMMGGYKVFLVQEAERMSIGAQNALLKTLEEPPPRTIIVLLAVHADRMLPTTLSRCQLVPFVRLPQPFVVEKLIGKGADSATARFLARQANGSAGAALQMWEGDVAGFKRQWLSGLVSAGQGPAVGPVLGELVKSFQEVCEKLAEEMQRRDPDAGESEPKRESARMLFSLLSTFLRDALWMSAGGGQEGLIHSDQADLVQKAAGKWPRSRLLANIDAVQYAEKLLDSNVNVPLNLDVLLNKLVAA